MRREGTRRGREAGSPVCGRGGSLGHRAASEVGRGPAAPTGLPAKSYYLHASWGEENFLLKCCSTQVLALLVVYTFQNLGRGLHRPLLCCRRRHRLTGHTFTPATRVIILFCFYYASQNTFLNRKNPLEINSLLRKGFHPGSGLGAVAAELLTCFSVLVFDLHGDCHLLLCFGQVDNKKKGQLLLSF